jgi:hypothetical protein
MPAVVKERIKILRTGQAKFFIASSTTVAASAN